MFITSIFFGLALFLGAGAGAVPENNFDVVYDLLRDGRGNFYRQGSFVGQENVKVRFTRFGTRMGQEGSVVIAPGRTESSMKYLELAYDLIQSGFSPVYVIDHRGQGFSERSLEDPSKGYVADFDYYHQDFAQFVDLVLQDRHVYKQSLHLISHSMGGAIAMAYLKNHQSPFKSATFVAPMFKLPLDKPESEVLRDTWMACNFLGRCNEYIPDGKPFDWNDRHFTGNDVTNSRTRYEFQNKLYRKWPETQLGSPTIKWVRESLLTVMEMRTYTYLSPISTRMIMFQAENDTVVDKTGQNEVCSHLRRNCTLMIVRGAKHEILMEKDRLRNAVLAKILPFMRR